MRVVGTQIPPAKMSIQIAITGKAKVQIQGRLHKEAPWVDIGEKRDQVLPDLHRPDLVAACREFGHGA